MAEKKTGAQKGVKKVAQKKKSRAPILTHDGHKLTVQESKFINKYIETGNGGESVKAAGYKSKTPEAYAYYMLNKAYIASEIRYRMGETKKSSIATAQEVMEYFTKVMNGEIKDQFNLEAPLSERTKAAQELAKRTVDIENRLAGKEDAKVVISIDWKRE